MSANFASENPIFGGALHRTPRKRAEVAGTIARVNPLQGSCDVSAEGDYYANVPLPGLKRDVEGSGGAFEVPRRGTPVVLQLSLGWPVISQVLPLSTDQEVMSQPSFDLDPTGATDGTLFDANDGPTFLGRLPKDMHFGDKGWVGNQGQHITLLDGGVVSLGASPMALVEVNQEEDSLLLAGRNTHMISGFGNIKFSSVGGKSGFLFEGGTDQLTQTGAGKGNWPVRLEIGREAEGLLNFQTNDLRGQRLTSLTVDMDGSEQRYNAGNISTAIEGSQEQNIRQGRNTYITQGPDYLEVQGAREEHIYGTYTTEAFGTRFCRVGGDRRDTVMRDWSLAAMRNMKVNVSGDAILSNPTTNALDVVVTNGHASFDIGNPLAGDTVKATSGFRVNTHGMGNIELLANELGMLMLDSALPLGSVYLGANLSAQPKAPKGAGFEPAVLGWRFIALLTAVVATFDTHTHMLPPPVAALAGFAPTLPPLALMSATVAPNIPFSVSKKVMVGT